MKTKIDIATHLRQFRDDYPLLSIIHQGQTWHYYDTSAGDDVLLLMPGNGGTIEALFPYIMGFAAEFRVIAPDISVKTPDMETAIAGIYHLITTLDIRRLHVMGMSFGGMLAQLFLRRYPDVVDNVILTHTTVPAPHIAEIVRMQRAFINTYPDPVLMFLVNRRLSNDLKTAVAPALPAERQFWQTYYSAHYRTDFRKAHLRSRARLSNEYHNMPPFQPTDIKTWKGDMLIIESGADEVIAEGDRGALLALYRRAYVQTLPEMSHLATILASEQLINSSLNFLLRDV